MLRMAANANKAKLVVNPDMFSNGVVQKKYKVYHKYMLLIKEILEIIKISEISQCDKYAALTKHIHGDLKQIAEIAQNIQQEE